MSKRHTAPYLLSHFLNSKDSFSYTDLTGNYISILRYMYDVMEMNFNKTGNTYTRVSNAQISIYARVGRATVTRAINYFVKHKLLSIVQKKSRCITQYSIGEHIQSRLTMILEEDSTRLTMSHQLGSPRATSKKGKEGTRALGGRGAQKQQPEQLQERSKDLTPEQLQERQRYIDSLFNKQTH